MTSRMGGRSLADGVVGTGRLFELWVAAAIGLWAAGVTLPVLRVTTLFIFEDAVALWPATKALAAEGEWLLATVVFAFTLLFPVAKLAGLWLAYRLPTDRAGARLATRFVDFTGKWSMLDVFVVALIVVILKGNWIAEAETDVGLYCFFVSVLLTMLATFHLRRLQQQAGTETAA